jgi:membrane protease subunit HflK
MDNIPTGKGYSDVIAENINPFLRTIVEDAVVSAMVHYTIDEALFEQVSLMTERVRRQVQRKLDKTESGIEVSSIQLTDKTWPRQVDRAFQASIQASQKRQTMVNEAQSYRENTLNEAAGPVASQLYKVIKSDDVPEERREELWQRAAGQTREILSDARTYRTTIVEEAKADVEYLQQILPEYRKRPKLVLQEIYQNTVSEVLDNAKEKMIIQPSDDAESKELRVLINRDPAIKDDQNEEQ